MAARLRSIRGPTNQRGRIKALLAGDEVEILQENQKKKYYFSPNLYKLLPFRIDNAPVLKRKKFISFQADYRLKDL